MAIQYDVFSLFSFPVGKLTPQRLLYPCGTSLVVSTVSFLLHRKKSHFQHHFDPPPLWLRFHCHHLPEFQNDLFVFQQSLSFNGLGISHIKYDTV